MKLTKKQISEISGNLEMGFDCYLSRKDGAILSIPHDDYSYADDDLWIEINEEIEKNTDNYLKIEQLNSYEAFQIMEEFTQTIDDTKIKDRLIYALNKPKPFKNFKYEIDYCDEIRDAWFSFKTEQYKKYVIDFFENYE